MPAKQTSNIQIYNKNKEKLQKGTILFTFNRLIDLLSIYFSDFF